MSVDKQIASETSAPKPTSWRGQAAQLAAIVLVVFVAKGALAEPFYIPSGSMEPTLLIGDALLASKYPYGYGTSSLPIQINLPETGRVFGGHAEARRRRGVPLAGRPLAGLGQARRRPARRPHPDAAGPALHQRTRRCADAGRRRPGPKTTPAAANRPIAISRRCRAA